MNALKVTKKELREMLRDKRVRSALLMPLIMVVLMIKFFGFIEQAASTARTQTLYVVKSTSPLMSLFGKMGGKVQMVASAAEGEKLIRDGKAGLVLDFGPVALPGQQATITAYLDPQKDTSLIQEAALEKVVDEASKSAVLSTLEAHGIPKAAAEPIKLQRKEVIVGSQGAGQMAASFLPYLIVLFAFTGAASLASDMVAGEKEKNTLETLLITPVARTEIVFGKFLALSAVSFAGAAMALLGLGLASVTESTKTSEMFKGGFGLTPTSVGLIALLILPLVGFFSSILIAISSYAKNPREAQTYLAIVNLLVIFPAIFSQIIGLTDLGSKLWINAVPILNTANNIRNALQGRAQPLPVLITVAMSVLIAAVAIRIAVWLFNREEVLTRV